MGTLRRRVDAEPFMEQVNGIPQYYEIITQPMHLHAMKKKLNGDEYGCVNDFKNDFELIISNTKLFNGIDHEVTHHGLSLQGYFIQLMKAVPNAT